MTGPDLTPEMALAMLKQKRFHAIERRAQADEEIRITEAQIAGFETAVEMLTPKAEAPAAEPAGEPQP